MNNPLPEPANDTGKKRRNQRNLAVFLLLIGFVFLVYAITIVKIKLGFGE